MTNTATGAGDPRPIKLSCRNLWKVFGPRAHEFMAEHGGEASAADLERAHLVGAVRSASLDVREGEIFIVMGLSGSGKSTLVRCLSRLIEPTAGELVFDGRDLLKASEAELIDIRRHKMGMVFQHFALLPHLNVRENVAFPLFIQGIGKPDREARAQAMLASRAASGGSPLSCRAASSSASASPARWRWSRKSGSSTNLSRPLTH